MTGRWAARIAGSSPATSSTATPISKGFEPNDPQYIPIGLATGSQTNVLLKIEEMIKLAHGQVKRVIPIHDEALKDMFPSRITSKGLRITELALAKGENSRVH